MNNVIIWGNGRMGKIVAEELTKINTPYVVVDVDTVLPKSAQIIIDFSSHLATQKMLEYAVKNKISVVIGTTGHTDSELTYIKNASKKIPIFFESNFSIGIYVVKKILEFSKQYLNDWDKEIIEYHHNQKTDTPSGTAKTLANIIKPKNVHSIRCGTMSGTHTLVFAQPNESITLTHNAENPNVFALGAIQCAEWLVGKPNGLYNLDSIYEKK